MTPLEEVQRAHILTGIPIQSFSFANLSEFKTFMDSFNSNDYPVHVCVPFESNGRYVSGLRKSVIPLQGWFLMKVKNDRFDFRSAKVEENFIKPMRDKAVIFLSNVVNSDLTDTEDDTINDTISPTYAFTAARLMGVSYKLSWPIVESICEFEDAQNEQ